MQSSPHSQDNPRLVMLAILTLLTVLSIRERRQKGRMLPMKSSHEQLKPVKNTSSTAPTPPQEVASSPISQRGRKKMLLSVAVSMLALAVILIAIVVVTLLPGLHLKTSEARPPSIPLPATQSGVTRIMLEKGIIFPRWSATGYGPADKG
jgi:hypothetical protein